MGRKNAYTDGEEGDRLVHSSQWRDIDSLPTDSSLRTNPGGIFSGAGVDDCVDENLRTVRKKYS
jgi:hypothetical protein